MLPHYGKRYTLDTLIEARTDKEDIFAYVRANAELASHAPWIARLEKPYCFPKIETVVVV